jgi:signal transduction histidine kinase
VSEQDELLSDAFHLLAQPIVALRARVELGLLRPLSEGESRKTLKSCLMLVDRLMSELALVREIATLQEERPPLAPCDGPGLVKEIGEELAPVAEEAGITLTLEAGPGWLLASEAALRRALFLLLDATLGSARKGSRVTLALRPAADEADDRAQQRYQLELRPGVPPGGRRELCRKLLARAGGTGLAFEEERSSAAFCAAGESSEAAPCAARQDSLTPATRNLPGAAESGA